MTVLGYYLVTVSCWLFKQSASFLCERKVVGEGRWQGKVKEERGKQGRSISTQLIVPLILHPTSFDLEVAEVSNSWRTLKSLGY